MGWNRKSPLDITFVADSPVESANEFKERLKASLAYARYAHELAKSSNASYAVPLYTPPSYAVGDSLWLNLTIFRDSARKSQISFYLSASGLFRSSV